MSEASILTQKCKMIEIIIIGSASGYPSADRACSSFLLNIDGKLYQFDVGEGSASSMVKQKFDHSKIGTIIISHAHADHIIGLFMEIQLMHLAKRNERLVIYIPDEVRSAVEQFLIATYLFKERMGFEIEIRSIQPDPVFRDEKITVYARPNSHLAGYKSTIDDACYPNKMQSYSYVIKTDTRRIIYSGDIGSLNDFADLLPECDLLITEGLYLDLEKLFEAVAENKVEYLLLTHLSDPTYLNPEHIKNLAAKYGVINLHIADDGFRLRI